jgi:hypothetical protein
MKEERHKSIEVIEDSKYQVHSIVNLSPDTQQSSRTGNVLVIDSNDSHHQTSDKGNMNYHLSHYMIKNAA